jgi:hypothetical protein
MRHLLFLLLLAVAVAAHLPLPPFLTASADSYPTALAYEKGQTFTFEFSSSVNTDGESSGLDAHELLAAAWQRLDRSLSAAGRLSASADADADPALVTIVVGTAQLTILSTDVDGHGTFDVQLDVSDVTVYAKQGAADAEVSSFGSGAFGKACHFHVTRVGVIPVAWVNAHEASSTPFYTNLKLGVINAFQTFIIPPHTTQRVTETSPDGTHDTLYAASPEENFDLRVNKAFDARSMVTWADQAVSANNISLAGLASTYIHQQAATTFVRGAEVAQAVSLLSADQGGSYVMATPVSWLEQAERLGADGLAEFIDSMDSLPALRGVPAADDDFNGFDTRLAGTGGIVLSLVAHPDVLSSRRHAAMIRRREADVASGAVVSGSLAQLGAAAQQRHTQLGAADAAEAILARGVASVDSARRLGTALRRAGDLAPAVPASVSPYYRVFAYVAAGDLRAARAALLEAAAAVKPHQADRAAEVANAVQLLVRPSDAPDAVAETVVALRAVAAGARHTLIASAAAEAADFVLAQHRRRLTAPPVDPVPLSVQLGKEWTFDIISGHSLSLAATLGVFGGTDLFDCADPDPAFTYELTAYARASLGLFGVKADAAVAEVIYGQSEGVQLADSITVEMFGQVLYSKALPHVRACTDGAWTWKHTAPGLDLSYTVWVTIIPLDFAVSATTSLDLDLDWRFCTCPDATVALGLSPSADVTVAGEANVDLYLVKGGVGLSATLSVQLVPHVGIDASACGVIADAEIVTRPMQAAFQTYYRTKKCDFLWIFDCHDQPTQEQVWWSWAAEAIEQPIGHFLWPF